MVNAEVMTLVIVSALYFEGNFDNARKMLSCNRYIKNMLSKSRLNRRIHAIDSSVWQVAFYAISEALQKQDSTNEYLIDSMPIPVCHPIRSYRCKLLSGKQYIGKCASKKMFYYGLKIHLISTGKGIPIEFSITQASTADITAFKAMAIDLPEGAIIYGDKAYTDYRFEDELNEDGSISLIAERKKNAKRQHSWCLQYRQKIFRKKVETVFSQLTALLPRKIHAITKEGFILKIVVFLVAFCLKQIV